MSKDYGYILRQMRIENNISIARLSEISGFSRHTIMAWESGRRECRWWRFLELEKMIKRESML